MYPGTEATHFLIDYFLKVNAERYGYFSLCPLLLFHSISLLRALALSAAYIPHHRGNLCTCRRVNVCHWTLSCAILLITEAKFDGRRSIIHRCLFSFSFTLFLFLARPRNILTQPYTWFLIHIVTICFYSFFAFILAVCTYTLRIHIATIVVCLHILLNNVEI